ncbi:DUF2784 domain-containing protein [Ramlibacter sp. USB13]|uniref:DUF2784 domain-containing protein n=1 Tax=Ramlibacter cellulosilyticus TaxID=2764187 RepID=A0A923MPC0_9BURK|nr:DUF2784 domain-containing protein [Ramlibacter cellulosilyticus]MBC5781759.1 DUF2784 domain-containing protein [Ramlibacter cellulosilyticus]
MTWRLLADAVLVLHLLFVAFAMLGGLLALHWRWMPWLHLPALAWGVTVEWTGGICPLTPLENALRMAGGAAGYQGGFVEHYLLPLLYPTGLTRGVQWLLGGGLLLFNAVAYLLVWRHMRRR